MLELAAMILAITTLPNTENRYDIFRTWTW